ncbi:hypothetical protein AVEN_133424-1 [Araneus ventricosus]|uniref:Uncharacterized protein n=1 Tax=Araneus ventricosus TaxID=182803 RepID=A0A4Y2SSI0_ARAVE|nr:hypothetical protein AVEN_133424-1 [Araneus ventricosus]
MLLVGVSIRWRKIAFIVGRFLTILNKTLKQFWEIESVDVECMGVAGASLCEDHFVHTHKEGNEEGRYVVSMALSRDPSCLGNSKDMAVRQLNSMWKRLSRDSEFC